MFKYNCSNSIANFFAVVLLGIMFILLFTSAWNDSGTMDELAHIPSGYSYLTQQDFRINPEHPPLIKDLSALPLLFLNLDFPTNVYAWKIAINGQWDMGRIFIYESGNDADRILHFSRFPIMLLALLFGWLFYRWIKSHYGEKVALLALFFFALSPTFLAHSKYVTTDLAAAFGFFIGLSTFINFLQKPTNKRLLIAGIALGVALLLKFSLVLLAPIYFILGVLWVFLNNYKNFKLVRYLKENFFLFWKIILIGIIALVVIFPVYLFHIWQYPAERQIQDTTFLMQSYKVRLPANITIWLSGNPALRWLGQYALGFFMVLGRAAGGNNVYYLGEVANVGWPSYFPLLYLLKEHLAFHILTVIGLWFGIRNILKSKEKSFGNILGWMKENFALTASLIFIAIYWTQAISSPLNIGVRHVLPTFPFIYLLVSRQTMRWVKGSSIENPKTFIDWIKGFYGLYIKPLKKGLFVCLLLVWIFLSIIVSFPNYLSYYNELAGGTRNGYKIAVDSNYDWGQDLKRLRDWIDKNVPADEQIAIDYFGGGNPEYYLGDRQVLWHSNMGSPADRGIKWFAVSLSFLQEGRAIPVKGFKKPLEEKFLWLEGIEPVARAGTSIFIYKF